MGVFGRFSEIQTCSSVSTAEDHESLGLANAMRQEEGETHQRLLAFMMAMRGCASRTASCTAGAKDLPAEQAEARPS